MAMTTARWNEIPTSDQFGLTQNPGGTRNAGPYEHPGSDCGVAFMVFTFGADAYDPTNHLTTMPFSGAAGANPRDVVGFNSIQQVEVNGGGSSDADIATGAIKATWVENGQYFKLYKVGATGNDNETAIVEVELDNVAGGLSGLRLCCVCYGSP